MRKFLGRRRTFLAALLPAVVFASLLPPVCRAEACQNISALENGGGGVPPSSITSITPNVWQPGNTYTVVITGVFTGNTPPLPGCAFDEINVDYTTGPANGDGFYLAASYPEYSGNVQYTGTEYLTTSVPSYTNNGTNQIGFTVTVASGAPSGTVTIDADCDGDCPEAEGTVQVGGSAPTITSVTPLGWWAGQKQQITITGTNFLTSADAHGPSKVTATATGVTLSNVTVASSTQITATVEVTKDASAETVALTVTNPPKSKSPGSATASPAPVVLPVPVIDWRGKKISGDNANTQKVKTGQPVELTATPATLPGGFTISQSTWDIDGTTIKSYSADDSGITLEETDLDKPNTNFYWLYPDTGLNVTYDYCATGSDGTQYCTSPQAKATFDAQRPNIQLTVTDPYNQGKVNELPICGQPQRIAKMFYGDLHYLQGCTPPYTGPEGIDLTASGGDNGTYTFAQVIESDTLSWDGDSPFQCGPYVNVLDFGYPFPGVRPNQSAPLMAYDGPAQSLPNVYSSGTRSFHAVMYLLWQPPQLGGTGTASIPVPIGHQDWQFVATATQRPPIGGGRWNQPDTGAKGRVGGFIPSNESDNAKYGYPTWNGVSPIASCNPTNQTQETQE